MARRPRVVIPSFPHHVTQRGNRRQKTFFCVDDYIYDIELLAGKNSVGKKFRGTHTLPLTSIDHSA